MKAEPHWHVIRGADPLPRLRIQPRAAHTGFAEVRGGRLRIRLQAPPRDGAANESLIRLLAHALDVPRSAVSADARRKSRDQEVLVCGGAAHATRLLALPGTHEIAGFTGSARSATNAPGAIRCYGTRA